MTTDQLALLQTINANPGDDAPRLVYADWLSENGQEERGEFIRVQCELANTPESVRLTQECSQRDWEALSHHHQPTNASFILKPPFKNRIGTISFDGMNQRYEALRRRERELLDENWSKWIRGIGIVPPEWKLSTDGEDFHIWRDAPFDDGYRFRFSRGFISKIACTAETFLRIAPLLVWREGERVECPECDGTGHLKIQDACSRCEVTGTVPRPMPKTVQPIKRVRLTTRPDEGFGGFRSVTFIPVAEDYRQSRSIMTFVPEARVEYHRWPGIVFELPEAGAMPPQVRAVRRDMR